jgi:ParB family chromosome partitioning protein
VNVFAGGIELDRAVDSIMVGARHRKDLGDLTRLVESIRQYGVLQPITITPDGVLLCGARRLAAVKELGWRTVNVWVRRGVSGRLGELLGEQEENILHKPFNHIEGASLYREIKSLLAEDAARRQHATQYEPGSNQNPRSQGGETVSTPWQEPTGDTREQASKMVTGRLSFVTFERVNRLQDIADDETQPATVRERAAAELARIEAGGSVKGADQRMSATLSITDLERIAADGNEPATVREQARAEAAALRDVDHPDIKAAHLARLAAEAIERTKSGKRKASTPRATSSVAFPITVFYRVWDEMATWWVHYDPAVIGPGLSEQRWASFQNAVHGTNAFLEAATEARHTHTGKQSA